MCRTEGCFASAFFVFIMVQSDGEIGGNICCCGIFCLFLDKIGCTSIIKTNKFVLYYLRFALSLQKIGCTSA